MGVAEMVRAVNASTRYSCLPDAGFFLDHADLNGKPTTTPQFQSSFYAWNASAGINQACITHYLPQGEEWRCMFAQYVMPFIQSPLFIAQNLYDSWQLTNILKVGCGGYGQSLGDCSRAQMAAVHAYGATMRSALKPLLAAKPEIGIFAPSCIAHRQTVENEHPAALWQWPLRWSIGNVTPRDSFDAWYSSAARNDTHLVQMCDWGLSCNPKCPLFTSESLFATWV